MSNETVFQPGVRVELVHTTDTDTRLVPGDQGTVQRYRDSEDMGPEVGIRWDSGSNLSMLLDEGDIIRVVGS